MLFDRSVAVRDQSGTLDLNQNHEIYILEPLESTKLPPYIVDRDLGELANCAACFNKAFVPLCLGTFLATIATMLSCPFMAALPTPTFFFA